MGISKRANLEAAKQRAQVEKRFRFGVVVAVAIAVVGYAMVFIAGRYGQVHTLHADVDGAEQLKEVFFSGEPWLIQCVSDEVPLHAASVHAARALASSSVNVASLRCLDRLPSGKTFFQRFGFRDDVLPDKDHPLYFLFANNDPPKRPKGGDLRNQTTIAAFAARESQPRFHAIKNAADLTYHCVKRRSCVLFAASGPIDTDSYKWVAEKHRNSRFVTVDLKDFGLSFLEAAGVTNVKDISPSEPKVFVLRSTLTEEEIKKRREVQQADRDAQEAYRAYQQKAKKSGSTASPPPKPKPTPPQPSPFGVHVHGHVISGNALDNLVNSHLLGGDGKGDGWVQVVDPKANPLKVPETATERARRERREEARRAHEARKHARETGADEVESVDADGTRTTVVHDDDSSTSGDAKDLPDLEIEDDDIVVTDDEE